MPLGLFCIFSPLFWISCSSDGCSCNWFHLSVRDKWANAELQLVLPECQVQSLPPAISYYLKVFAPPLSRLPVLSDRYPKWGIWWPVASLPTAQRFQKQRVIQSPLHKCWLSVHVILVITKWLSQVCHGENVVTLCFHTNLDN